MRNLLFAAVHTTEYGTEVHLFNHEATGDHPLPPSNPEKLAALLGINFIEGVDSLVAAPVKNPDFTKKD